MTRQFWSEADLDYLRTHYKRMPIGQLAEKLGRTVRSVYNTAKKYGIASPQLIVSDKEIKAAIRKLHPKGWADSEIGRELSSKTGTNVDRHRISNIRKAMGLPSNAMSDRRRNQIRDKTKEQLASSKLENLAELRSVRYRQWKRDLGWPEHLTVRAVQSLEMFYQHGPMTRAQLCVLLGISSKSRTAPKSRGRGGTVLAELAAAGLISRVAKAVPIPFDMKLHDDPYGSKPRKTSRVIKTKQVSLYFLNPGVEPDENRKATKRDEPSGSRPADSDDSQGHDELASPDAGGGGQLDKRRRRQSDRPKAGRKSQAG